LDWLSDSKTFLAPKEIMPIIDHTNSQQRLAQITWEEGRAKRAARNPKFIQFRCTAIRPFRNLMERSNIAARVLLCLAEEMSPSNGISYSVSGLLQEAGASRSSVYDALRMLENERWIQKVSDDAGTHYRVNSNVFWTSSNVFRDQSFDAALELPRKSRPRRVTKMVVARVGVKPNTP
jgi:Fe2+ or Zn2+ uptake regulation protein